ncbi:hypothetical protein [Collimonas fungivorans]|uniref:hypothetical protein n=1 Tax=Collimonas fungivorans TaxID=158899 RepID=UPI0011D237B7|nr:hypothetical protein [Collimonas fungivorans]
MKKTMLILGLAGALATGSAGAEVDKNGCRNTAKQGYICKAQTDATWQRKRQQEQAKRNKQDLAAQKKHTGLLSSGSH